MTEKTIAVGLAIFNINMDFHTDLLTTYENNIIHIM